MSLPSAAVGRQSEDFLILGGGEGYGWGTRGADVGGGVGVGGGGGRGGGLWCIDISQGSRLARDSGLGGYYECRDSFIFPSLPIHLVLDGEIL